MENNISNIPLVSIVIPTYNAKTYLMEAVESVLGQTYPHIELIIVDDGSTDNTEELLNKNSRDYRYYKQENAGQSAALNFGWQQSTGEILGYLSADDRLHPEAISTIVKEMEENPHVVLAYPDFSIIDNNSNHVRNIITPDYDAKLLIANFHCLPGPGALFQRKAWMAAGEWNTKFRGMPDMDYYFRLSIQGPFLRVKQRLADYRIHPKSITYSKASAEQSDEPIMIVESFFEQQDISPQLRAWQKRTTANALMLSGFMHCYSGRYWIFVCRILKAALISPTSVMTKKMVNYLSRIFTKKGELF